MTTFNDLLNKHKSIDSIPYFELIQTREWYDKRERIVIRDKHKCTICGKSATVDHTHVDPETGVRTYPMFTDDYPSTQNEKGDWIESEIPIIDYLDKPYSLHVHHKFYILDRQPWEYLDDDLITFCNWCHWKFHEANVVPVFRTGRDKMQVNMTPCSRCNGAGWFPEYEYVQNGICFKCKGARFEELIK